MNENSEKNFVITERDKQMLREINRWKCPLGRHIKRFSEFSGTRAMDRRLKKLIEAGYLERKYYVYGIPGIYSITPKAKGALGISYYKYHLRLDEISHNIATLDTAIYVHEKFGVLYCNMTSERELHRKDGFSNRKHQPDFLYRKDEKVCAVEVELTPKNQKRFEENVESNYTHYDSQLWVIPNTEYRIKNRLEACSEKYPDIEILSLEEVERHVKGK